MPMCHDGCKRRVMEDKNGSHDNGFGVTIPFRLIRHKFNN